MKKQSTLFSFFKATKDSIAPGDSSAEVQKPSESENTPSTNSAKRALDLKTDPDSKPNIKKVRKTPNESIEETRIVPSESASSESSSYSSDYSSSSSSEDSSCSGSEVDSPRSNGTDRVDAPAVDVEKLFVFHSQPSEDASQEFLTPMEPPSIRREFRVNMKSATDLNEPILSVEEIDKLCKNVPPFVRQFTHMFYEYCNRFDFPSWFNPKNLKDKNMRTPSDPDYDVGTLLVPRKNGKVNEDGHSTPMLQQYWDIKEDHFNEIILFKVGKFYELFYIDAAIAQSVCNLKWMGHDRRAHVGFPEVSLQHHASMLIDQGYTVCVVEQTETVNEANERSGKSTGALVERKICEVFTTGTLIHDNMLSNSDAHYIAAVYMSSSITVVMGDCSTGRFSIHSVSDLTKLKTLLFTFSPKEIIYGGPEDLARLLAGYRELTGCVVSRWSKWDGIGLPKELEVGSAVREFVGSSFDVKKCVAGIVNYLDHLLLREQVTMCSTWEVAVNDEASSVQSKLMVLDATVLSHLEILRDSENSERGSLLKFLNQTRTKFGSRMFRKWICTPLTDMVAISARQDAVEFFKKSSKNFKKQFESLAEMGDLERALQRICAQALQQSRNAVFFNEVENKRIANFLSFLDSMVKSCGFLEKLASVGGEPPMLIQSLIEPSICGEIRAICDSLKCTVFVGKDSNEFTPKPGAFTDYDTVLEKIKLIESELKLELERVRSDVIGSKEPVFVSVKFRYEIEVPIKHEKIVKDNLFEVTSGRKGYVRFLTENVKELVGRMEAAEQEKKDLLYPFMSKLFSELNAKRFLFNALIQRLAELDCLHALSIISSNENYVRPVFGTSTPPDSGVVIRLIQCRHPVQEHLMQLERKFVPNDIVVGESGSTLLVTGANMGGKSTILRQICINVIMAQMGCFVPASACYISQPIDRIFTRIGASDNILEGKSTFLTELEETAVVLREATQRSLVVIDELGRGTSTFDGVAIAGATLAHITNSIGCNCLFATHYHKLCTEENISSLGDRVQLFHMECKSNGENEIELTHKFKRGSYPHSQAMHVARIAGIPEQILIEADKVSQEFLKSISTGK